MNNKVGSVYYFDKTNKIKNPKLHLSLEIDQFYSTDNAEVDLSGHYAFYNKEKLFESIKHFNVTGQLTSDGYKYSVEKLNNLLDQLIIQIIISIPL